jgi:hypothetical protein
MFYRALKLLVRTPTTLTELFRDIPQFLTANARTVPVNRPWSLPPKYLKFDRRLSLGTKELLELMHRQLTHTTHPLMTQLISVSMPLPLEKCQQTSTCILLVVLLCVTNAQWKHESCHDNTKSYDFMTVCLCLSVCLSVCFISPPPLAFDATK